MTITSHLLVLAMMMVMMMMVIVECKTAVMNDDTMRNERFNAKPWFLRDMQLWNGQVTIPISPITLVISMLSIYNLVRALRSNNKKNKVSWAEASHILLTGDKAQSTLDDYKKKINNDATQFAFFAETYSACPSGKQNKGNLGKFHPGDMAPPFCRAVFSPEASTLTTIGPIETQFGWHLIYIHQRQLQQEES